MAGNYKLLPDGIKKKLPDIDSKEANVTDQMVWTRFFDPSGSWEFFVISGK